VNKFSIYTKSHNKERLKNDDQPTQLSTYNLGNNPDGPDLDFQSKLDNFDKTLTKH